MTFGADRIMFRSTIRSRPMRGRGRSGCAARVAGDRAKIAHGNADQLMQLRLKRELWSTPDSCSAVATRAGCRIVTY